MTLARECIDTGKLQAAEVAEIMRETIEGEPIAEIDYIEIVDGSTLEPVETIKNGDLVALAVYIGNTRLIDNFTVSL